MPSEISLSLSKPFLKGNVKPRGSGGFPFIFHLGMYVSFVSKQNCEKMAKTKLRKDG